ncbi:methyltransferase type 11 [Methylococcaceae bacterium HT1]|nr:methyltransferase type 11 [Methylococcaceae bacterium HT1]TXL16058.1 methyltransferase type 11 [Methylococcaceae bacterium HT3]TXL22487.1 methyltransferase type 11 [Methylococcaceae bacterium HT2]
MHRKVLLEWFATSKGQILQQQEAAFLQRSITVSCKQIVVQIGALGWENDFIDCSLYQQFYVMDDEQDPWYKSKVLRGTTVALPFKSESVDMVILPHLLEFDRHKHQVLREVERILKPEGKLTILSFNPWNIYINLQYMKRREKHTPWIPGLVSRTRVEDWLRLLNFEVELAAGFNFDATRINSGHAEGRGQELRVAAYGIKAIKRCYHLIPLTPIREYQQKFAMAKLINIPLEQRQYDKDS